MPVAKGFEMAIRIMAVIRLVIKTSFRLCLWIKWAVAISPLALCSAMYFAVAIGMLRVAKTMNMLIRATAVDASPTSSGDIIFAVMTQNRYPRMVITA